MLWMTKLPATCITCKSTLTIVDEHVIVERVLAREGGIAYLTDKCFNSSMRPARNKGDDEKVEPCNCTSVSF